MRENPTIRAHSHAAVRAPPGASFCRCACELRALARPQEGAPTAMTEPRVDGISPGTLSNAKGQASLGFATPRELGGPRVASTVLRARRAVLSPEPCLQGESFDYADSFEVAADDDARPVVQYARAGLEGAPAPLRATIVFVHRWVLGFRLHQGGEESVLGWQIVTSARDVVVLEAHSPLIRGVIVARRDTSGWLRLSTYLHYRRRALATLLWFAVGPVHRRIAPYLLVRAVTGGDR